MRQDSFKRRGLEEEKKPSRATGLKGDRGARGFNGPRANTSELGAAAPPACALFTTLLKDRQQTFVLKNTSAGSWAISNWGALSMLETAIALIIGFALGYGVREWLFRRRRRVVRHRRQLL